jgi:hypothetical protein
MKPIRSILYLLLVLACPFFGAAQSHFLEPADSLHRGRFWTCVGIGATLYGSASYGLYHAWYKDFEQTRFQTFDDSGEWLDMDKAGHLMTAYNQAEVSFDGLLWTGMPRRTSMWMAAGVGTILQTTIEVMDAHSAKWGFSWYDIGFNTAGVGLFVGQELLWKEQRIRFKISNTRPNYPDYAVPNAAGGPSYLLSERADELYGSSYAEAFLKDYNGQVVWASANIKAFTGAKAPDWVPPWLNVAVGYSGENMFGGFSNSWTSEAGFAYDLDEARFPRYRQLYLSFDIDLERIPTRKRWLRTVFGVLNWIKIPSPALEFNQGQGVRFRPLMW